MISSSVLTTIASTRWVVLSRICLLPKIINTEKILKDYCYLFFNSWMIWSPVRIKIKDKIFLKLFSYKWIHDNFTTHDTFLLAKKYMESLDTQVTFFKGYLSNHCLKSSTIHVVAATTLSTGSKLSAMMTTFQFHLFHFMHVIEATELFCICSNCSFYNWTYVFWIFTWCTCTCI